MDTCARCGAELGVGRFCLNCGHRIGAPVPPPPVQDAEPVPTRQAEPEPVPDPPPAPAPPHRGWDPAEDLLPFDDDTAPGVGTTRVSSGAMLAWVVGAAVLVALVFVLLRVFGVDGDGTEDSATDPSSSQEPPAVEEIDETDESDESDEQAALAAVGKAANVARAARFVVPATAPPTTDLDGQLVSYTAPRMHDGLPSTAWRMVGDGSGAVLTITLRQPTVVTRVGLINGYAKRVSGVDWYPNNRRILAAQWGFDDGTTLDQALTERPDLQRLDVPKVLTSTVTLTISSVTPPGAGTLGRDYTAISEVVITGRRAR